MSEDGVERRVRKLRDELRAVQDVQTEHTARFDSVDGQPRSLTQMVGRVLDRLPEDPAPSA